MDDVKHQDLDDLFSSAEGASTGEDDVKHQSSPVTEQDELDTKSPRVEAEAVIVENLAAKISRGESSLDELAEKQPWLVEKVKAKLSSSQTSSLGAEEIAAIASKAAREAFLAEERKRQEALDDQGFSLKVQELKAITTQSQQSEINALVKEYRAKGLSRGDALDVAIAKLRIDLSDPNEKKRNYPVFRQGGGIAPRPEPTKIENINPNTMSYSELVEYQKTQRRG